METKIKNTLFRFTSLRKPELISDEKKASFFIRHPRVTESDLYATTEEAFQTKLDEFAAAVAPVKVKDKDALKALNPELYNFGFWLLQNRESISPQDYMAKIDELSLTMQLSDDDEDLVWDNFIYQISRHTDESAREAAMVLLYANYIFKEITVSDSLLPGGNTINKTEKELKRWLQARIVRPEYLAFSVPPVSDPGTMTGSSSLSIQTQKQFKAAQERLISSIKIAKLQNLQKELKSSAKKYNKAEADNFKAYKTQYDSDYSDYLAALQNPVESFTGEPEPLPPPPAYNYIPLPQLDIDVLETQLSTDSLSFYNDIKSDEIITFSDIDKFINDNINAETETIFNNKTFSTTYKSVGGMLVPVTNNNTSNSYTCHIFQTDFAMGKRSFGINIMFPNNTLAVRSIDYKITVGTVVKGHLTFSPGIGVNNSGVVTGSLFYSPYGVEVSPSDEILFEADLTTNDGNKYTISKIIDLNKKLNTATLVPVTTGTAVDPKDPIKSYTKYGITRLGIADYRRVEQTICCYVPGEVSHIENIMSREYKERSTKRLRRSETTVTTEKSTETENLTDTTSTDRNEMHQEMSKMMQESKDFNASAGIKFGKEDGDGPSGHIDAAFAYHNNKEESNSQARTQARELTERAMDRVVTKVREERINKIIDEFTEENKHGYDNREGNNHISGVYRWVDKIYTNEIFNYGKRLMYEFMIPEPSKFHLIYTNGDDRKNNLVKPVDPRLDPDPATRLVKFTDVTAANYAKWASFYNADVEAPPFFTLNMGKSYNGQGGDGKNSNNFNDFKIPEGYRVTEIKCAFNLKVHTNFNVSAYIIVADVITPTGLRSWNEGDSGMNAAVTSWTISYSPLIAYTSETIPVSIVTWDVGAYALNVNATFERTDEWMTKWQVATFHKIIQAYEDQLAMYEQKLAEFQSQTAEQRRTNPLFNRDIENMVLRKNCISYILGYDYLGKNFQVGTTVFDHNVSPDAVDPNGVVVTGAQAISLIQYASMAKFVEQAFEWEIMSYIFYPFYWGTGKDWETLYGGNADDTLFAKFIQSGLARVVITVRPGFEDAVNWFLNTGQIWNGMSSPPVIGDDMYLSIVEELQEPEYFVEGSWETRVPSTLTVIQAGVIGLDASGLPCECKREYDGDGNVISGSKDEIKQYNSAFLESGGTSGGGVWEILDEGTETPPVYVPPGNPTS